MLIPWKSNHHFLWLGFRTTFIFVGVYHLPKGTTIFLNGGNDFHDSMQYSIVDSGKNGFQKYFFSELPDFILRVFA